jgi:hypothetical protein
MKEISWRDALNDTSSAVEYRVCSEHIAWRPANNFGSVYAALFETDGAFNMFHSHSGLRVEEQREKYGTPHFCAAWANDTDTGTALLTDGSEIAAVPRELLSSIPKTSVYRFAKWDVKKKEAERVAAAEMRGRLARIFDESSCRTLFTREAIDSIRDATSTDATEGAFDLTSCESKSDLVDDILGYLNFSTGATESLALVRSRVGQGVFRNVGLGNQFVASRGQEKTWAPRHRQRSAQPGQAGGFGKAEKNADSPPAAAFGSAQTASSAHRPGARRPDPSNKRLTCEPKARVELGTRPQGRASGPWVAVALTLENRGQTTVFLFPR